MRFKDWGAGATRQPGKLKGDEAALFDGKVFYAGRARAGGRADRRAERCRCDGALARGREGRGSAVRTTPAGGAALAAAAGGGRNAGRGRGTTVAGRECKGASAGAQCRTQPQSRRYIEAASRPDHPRSVLRTVDPPVKRARAPRRGRVSPALAGEVSSAQRAIGLIAARGPSPSGGGFPSVAFARPWRSGPFSKVRDAFQHLHADILVRHLAATEAERHLDLVALLDERLHGSASSPDNRSRQMFGRTLISLISITFCFFFGFCFVSSVVRI